MKRDQRKPAVLDPLDDRLTDLRRDLGIAHVPPPDQDLTVVEHTAREPLAGIVDADRSHRDARLGREMVGDLIAQEVGVGLLLGGLLLVPDDDPDGRAATARLARPEPELRAELSDRRCRRGDRRGFEKISPASCVILMVMDPAAVGSS